LPRPSKSTSTGHRQKPQSASHSCSVAGSLAATNSANLSDSL
jgi:hypothetical protein